MDPKQKLADYSRRGIFSDGQLFPKHVTRVFPSELEPASHHTKKLKWESILAINQDLGFCSKIFEKLLYYGFSSGQDQSESDRLNKGKLTWKWRCSNDFEQTEVKQRVKEARSGIIRTDKHHKKKRYQQKSDEKSRKPRAAHFLSTGLFPTLLKMAVDGWKFQLEMTNLVKIDWRVIYGNTSKLEHWVLIHWKRRKNQWLGNKLSWSHQIRILIGS